MLTWQQFLESKKADQWEQGAVKHPGAFTDYCGGKVTDKCIAKGKSSDDPHVVKMATLAQTFRKQAKKHKKDD